MRQVTRKIELKLFIFIIFLIIISFSPHLKSIDPEKKLKEIKKEFDSKKIARRIGDYEAVTNEIKRDEEELIEMNGAVLKGRDVYISAERITYEKIPIKVNGKFFKYSNSEEISDNGIIKLENVVIASVNKKWTFTSEKIYIFFDEYELSFISDKRGILKNTFLEKAKKYSNFQIKSFFLEPEVLELGKEGKEVISFMNLPTDEKNKKVSEYREEVRLIREKIKEEKKKDEQKEIQKKNTKNRDSSYYPSVSYTDEELERLDAEENEQERLDSDEYDFEDRDEREYWESEEYWQEEGF